MRRHAPAENSAGQAKSAVICPPTQASCLPRPPISRQAFHLHGFENGRGSRVRASAGRGRSGVGHGTEAAAGDSASCTEEPRIPANLTIEDPFLRSLVHEIGLRSSTFRRQLITIGAAPSLAARLHYTRRARISGALSQTTIARRHTGLSADIEIPMPLLFARRYIEFIAQSMGQLVEQEYHDHESDDTSSCESVD